MISLPYQIQASKVKLSVDCAGDVIPGRGPGGDNVPALVRYCVKVFFTFCLFVQFVSFHLVWVLWVGFPALVVLLLCGIIAR